MKKYLSSLIVLYLLVGISCQEKIDIEKENKRIAAEYHDLNPDNVDKILTEDFIGRHEQNKGIWNRENHREFLKNNPEMGDKIHSQIGEGDWVATRFTRTMNLNGKNVKIDGMHFKRFQNGKIAEIWEYGDSKQTEIED